MHSRGQGTQVPKPGVVTWLMYRALSVCARDGHGVLPANPPDGCVALGEEGGCQSLCSDQLWGLLRSGSIEKQSAHLRLPRSLECFEDVLELQIFK